MKIARFAYNGKIHQGEYRDDMLWVGTTSYSPDDVMWLPPIDVQRTTAIGIALGYADHAAELGLDLPDYPIVFHKMPNTLIGNKSRVVRPNVDYMHYEGELVAIIGKACRNVSAADALDYVGGYTIGNEYTVRDFVTNYYRPPVKAKGHDTFGPLGPVMVTPEHLDPTNVNIRTYLNGEKVQDGNTGNLRHSVAELIEFLSDFMTLSPGDMIFTGTPKGISHVNVGDNVRVEIDEIGVLESDVVAAL